jgi:N-acyl-D-amino-acid deacylase
LSARVKPTPAPRLSPGDIAIDSGLIAHVGGKAGPGKREIDADGLLITPGWVDVHTHYDQATWDACAIRPAGTARDRRPMPDRAR